MRAPTPYRRPEAHRPPRAPRSVRAAPTTGSAVNVLSDLDAPRAGERGRPEAHPGSGVAIPEECHVRDRAPPRPSHSHRREQPLPQRLLQLRPRHSEHPLRRTVRCRGAGRRCSCRRPDRRSGRTNRLTCLLAVLAGPRWSSPGRRPQPRLRPVAHQSHRVPPRAALGTCPRHRSAAALRVRRPIPPITTRRSRAVPRCGRSGRGPQPPGPSAAEHDRSEIPVV